MSDSNWTLRFPRTTRCDGHAIYLYRQPLLKRFFYAFIRHGLVAIALVLAVLALTGCRDIAAEEATAASLRDALTQAQQERPDLWTPERIERAGVAAGMVARSTK